MLIFLVLIIAPGSARAWTIGGSTYDYRYPILSNATTADLLIFINDTAGVNDDIFGIQNKSTPLFVYSSASGPAGSITIGNTTGELDWVNESSMGGNNPTSVAETNLTLWWAFGANASDYTSNGNDGTVDGATLNSSGRFGNAYGFDGTNDKIERNDIYSSDHDLAVSLWIRSDDGSPTDGLVSTMNSDTRNKEDFAIRISSGTIQVFKRTRDGNSDADSLASTTTVGSAAWYHILFVYDESEGDDGHPTDPLYNQGALTLYVNGVMEDDTASDDNYEGNSGWDKLSVGAYDLGAYFKGIIDDVRIYYRTLTATEALEIYWNGIDNLTALGAEEVDSADNVPSITIEDPDNITYYSTQIPLNFTATDDTLTTFPCWYLIDGTPTSIGNLTNNTYYNTTLSLNGAHYNLTVHCEDPAVPGNGSASEFFHVFSGFNVSVYDNDTNASMTDWTICFENSTDQDCSADQNDSVLFEWNTVPQGSVNVTISDASATLYYFNSTYARTNDESNYENLSAYLQEKSASTLTLTSSPAWTIDVNTEITITCTASESTPDLYRDGINVSNPYTATLDFDLFNFTCTIGETANYAPASTTSWLNVLSGGFGCTDNTTYAFTKTITTPANNMTLNFTTLVNNDYVKSDLSDVRVITTNTSTTKNGSYLIVSTENVSNITVRFANYFANVSHSDGTLITDSVDNMTSYSENDPYYVLTFIEETTGTEQIPPNSTRTLILYCSQGTTWQVFNDSLILVAANERLDSIKAHIEYSATEIYYRSLISRSSVEHKNFYLVDADEHQVAQMLITLQDATGDFNEATLIIRKYLEGTLETITELDFDAEDKAIIYLINGDRYQIYVDNGDETRNIGYLYVDTVDLSKTITIGEVLTTNQTHGNLSFGFYNTSDTIVFSYIDASGRTTGAEFWVYNASNTSQLLYYANTTNRSRGEFTYTVPSTNQTYNVHVQLHHLTFGENSIDLWMPMFADALTIPHPLSPLSSLFGTIPGGITWQNLVGVFAVIGATLLFTSSSGALGGVFAVVIGAVLFVFGWWTVNVAILAVGFVLGILNKLTEKKREA